METRGRRAIRADLSPPMDHRAVDQPIAIKKLGIIHSAVIKGENLSRFQFTKLAELGESQANPRGGGKGRASRIPNGALGDS